MSKKAIKLALEALRYHTAQTRPIHQTNEAIKSLEEALAKQEGQSNFCPQCEALARELKAIKQEQGKPVAEKVYDPEDDTAYIQYFIPHDLIPVGTKFYTTPQQRKPLTDKQIDLLLLRKPELSWFNENGHRNIARAIEAAHGIKGEA